VLRIRPENGTIRELNIPKENLEELQRIVSSPKTTDDIKKLMIKKFAKASPCCICGGIPSCEVVYDADGASRIERYCESCANRVFSRNAVLET
jgi:carbamate kinase